MESFDEAEKIAEVKKSLVGRLEELLKSDSVEQISAEAVHLEAEYEKALAAGQHLALEEFKAGGGDPLMFSAPKAPEDGRFKEMINLFYDRRDRQEQEKAAEREANLALKKQVIEDLRTLIAEEENISIALRKSRELKERWKSVGRVSPHKYKALQAEYSRLLEEFYYNIHIYQELQEHDFRRNLQLKEEVVSKMEALLEEKNIRRVQYLAGAYLSEWDEIGPTHREDWEKVRNRFHDVSHRVFERIKQHYKHLRDQQKQNLEEKRKLVEEARALMEATPEKVKDWNEITDKIKAIQQRWKGIGFATKKSNDKVWEELRMVCDQFFEKKRAFFAGLTEEHRGHAEKKRLLIEKAEQLKDSTDWKNAGADIMMLQKQWKETGAASQRDEFRLWKRFRAACDHFFNARKAHYEQMDEKLRENSARKEGMLNRLHDLALSGEKERDMQIISEAVAEWNRTGDTTKESRHELNNRFHDTVSALYRKAGLDETELASRMFSHKIENWSGMDGGEELMLSEKKIILDKVKKLTAGMLQYENNLGFFAASKGAESIRSEAEKKISEIRLEISLLHEKEKQLNIAIRKSRKEKEGRKDETAGKK